MIVTGPGVAFSRLAPFFAPWEEAFTLVQWDQPGAGWTYAKNGDAGTGALTFERLTIDGLAVAAFVRKRLDVRQLILLGLSAGSIVGLQMVHRRPDLFAAYVGSGQIVNWATQEARSYSMALERARESGDASAAAELERIGRPPYKDAGADAILSKYANALTPAEQAEFSSLDPVAAATMRTPPAGARYVARDFAPVDQRARAMAVYAATRSQIAAFDARSLGVEFHVPMFMFQGDQDMYTPTVDVDAFLADIRAPAKMRVLVQGGGHSAVFLRTEFLQLLMRHVRAAAGG